MRTIALRFSNNFAPDIGTIRAHEELINEKGVVWYGKLGSKISVKVSTDIMNNESPRILLIHSGQFARYWAYINKTQNEVPEFGEVPEYYRNRAGDFKSLFRVVRFEEAPKYILSHCFVASSHAQLSNASRHSMSPYFIMDVEEGY